MSKPLKILLASLLAAVVLIAAVAVGVAYWVDRKIGLPAGELESLEALHGEALDQHYAAAFAAHEEEAAARRARLDALRPDAPLNAQWRLEEALRGVWHSFEFDLISYLAELYRLGAESDEAFETAVRAIEAARKTGQFTRLEAVFREGPLTRERLNEGFEAYCLAHPLAIQVEYAVDHGVMHEPVGQEGQAPYLEVLALERILMVRAIARARAGELQDALRSVSRLYAFKTIVRDWGYSQVRAAHALDAVGRLHALPEDWREQLRNWAESKSDSAFFLKTLVLPVYHPPLDVDATLSEKVQRLSALRAYDGYAMLAEALEASRTLLPNAAEAFAAKYTTPQDAFYEEDISVKSVAKYSLQMQGPMAVLHERTQWAKTTSHSLAQRALLPLDVQVRFALAHFYQQGGKYPGDLDELLEHSELEGALDTAWLAVSHYEKLSDSDYEFKLIPADDLIAGVYEELVVENAFAD